MVGERSPDLELEGKSEDTRYKIRHRNTLNLVWVLYMCCVALVNKV